MINKKIKNINKFKRIKKMVGLCWVKILFFIVLVVMVIIIVNGVKMFIENDKDELFKGSGEIIDVKVLGVKGDGKIDDSKVCIIFYIVICLIFLVIWF